MNETVDPNASETARLAALADYGILDTPAEAGFDDIVTLPVLCAMRPIPGI